MRFMAHPMTHENYIGRTLHVSSCTFRAGGNQECGTCDVRRETVFSEQINQNRIHTITFSLFDLVSAHAEILIYIENSAILHYNAFFQRALKGFEK